MAHLLSLGHPATTLAGGTQGAQAERRGTGGEGGPVGRILATAGRALPDGRVRLMAALVFVTPFSGSMSELHARGGLPWGSAVPLGLVIGTAVWTVVLAAASVVRRRLPARVLEDSRPS